jgi:predicted site-specific integrase-resolvase
LASGPLGVGELVVEFRFDVEAIVETRSVSRDNARVSTAKQDLERQVDALLAAGIDPKHIYRDKKSGSTVDR